jgi:hypothetical protein
MPVPSFALRNPALVKMIAADRIEMQHPYRRVSPARADPGIRLENISTREKAS